MNKVVDKGIKVDLHIHSYYSLKKDPDKVTNNTIQNLPVLVNRLIENEVEMCAITDHDTFNYEMYHQLKCEEQKDNCIKKVLPGIEFSVQFVENKNSIHVVTIFSDMDDEKVKKIEEIMNSDKGKLKGQFYTKREYFDILGEIDLDFVMIAHQKKSITSDNVRAHDVMSLGKEKFNEFVFMDYFDAFEFRNKNNEIYNKSYVFENKVEENLRFITGSDCHRWEYYPKTEKDEKEEFGFTYIKSLPTFKGLAMAITDSHRISISCNFYNPVEKWQDIIQMNIDGNDITIPLSKGINVIIGDNSIGKSLLLNALTDYYKAEAKLRKGYQKYLDNHGIQINTVIPQNDIFMLNRQGEIRSIFDDEGMKPNKYLGQFYPETINASEYRSIAEREFERLYTTLEEKFEYDENVNKLPTYKMFLEEVSQNNISYVGKAEKIDISNIQDLLNHLTSVNSKLKEDILKNDFLYDDDKKHIKNILEEMETIKEKYVLKSGHLNKENEKINIFNSYMKKYKDEQARKSTDEQNRLAEFKENRQNTISDIYQLILQKKKIKEFTFNINTTIVKPNLNPVDEYQFVSKIGIEKVDNAYLESVLFSVLKKGNEICINEITMEQLQEMINRYTNDDDKTPLQILKEKIKQKFDKDFKVINTIVRDKMDVFEKLSAGFDAQTYFALISGEERNKGIYFIDQPEDHISQKAIKDNVLDQFRRMGSSRQVIMVTHNPQFIVNLDVDNVIYLTNKNGKFEVYSGALEYEDEEYNILKIVADNIEGGLQTILGRMKRYEKKI